MHPNGTGLQTLVHDPEGGIIAMDYHYRYDVYVCISYKCILMRQEVYAGIHIMHLFAPYRILIFLTISYHRNWLCVRYITMQQNTSVLCISLTAKKY